MQRKQSVRWAAMGLAVCLLPCLAAGCAAGPQTAGEKATPRVVERDLSGGAVSVSERTPERTRLPARRP